MRAALREDASGERIIRKVGQKHRMAEQSFREQARKSPKSQRIAELSAKKENYGVPLWDHQNGPAGGLTDLGEKEIFHHLYEQNKLGPMNLTSMKNKRELQTSRALATLPPEVTLCTSSIPGAGLGVMTRSHMPAGTIIGPFEGQVVQPENVTPGLDTSNLWEVYKDGKVNHFIDGSDDRFSCWMRHIQCARHSNEQNLCAFQYQQQIFYRAIEGIRAGRELLVWYDSSYTNFMGIPYGIQWSQPEAFRLHWQSYNTAPRKQREARLSSPNPPPEKSKGPSSPPSVDYSAPTATSDQDQSSTKIPSPGMVDYTEWNLWKCGMCHKTFTQRIMLQMHMCSSAPIKPYQCGYCCLAFAQPNELRHHMVTHTADRPFKCGFCSRTFAGTTTLQNHIRTHTGDKPFTCDECGQSFGQAAQLSKHQKTPAECPGQLNQGQ